MAKATPSGKDYGSSEPKAPEGADAPAGDDVSKDPEAKLQDKQVRLLMMKAAEKRLQDEIGRLTAFNATYKAWLTQVNAAAVAAVTTARSDLNKFVESGKKALDEDTKKKILKARQEVDDEIATAEAKYKKAVLDTKDKQTARADAQLHLSTATETYANAKAVTTRVKQATTDLLAVRQKIEALVKADDFAAAGFWLFELEQQLKDAPVLDKALSDLSDAWRDLEQAHNEVGTADDALTTAVANEAAAKKALDDAAKNRVTKITDSLAEPASPKPATAA